MAREKIHTAEYSEIFRFAEDRHGLDWNTCNDIFFHNHVLRHKGYDKFNVEELKTQIEDIDSQEETESEYALGSRIIHEFMKSEGLKNVVVLND